MPENVTLEVSELSFSYGSKEVLHGIDFTAKAGDLMAVLGPNGVGKSTLFRCILGFLKGYGGSVRVNGIELKGMTPRQRAQHVAYIPQSSAQVFDYTVAELVLMGVASRVSTLHVPSHDEERQAYELLEELGIASLAYRGCGHISGGEYQLVLLARALMQQASILVMDEPTANLDYGNQYRVMRRIAGLAKRDFIVILSAHDPNQVLMHANRALVIEDGAVSADGSPAYVMTGELLSRMYRIDVHRHALNDQGHVVELCIPACGEEKA